MLLFVVRKLYPDGSFASIYASEREKGGGTASVLTRNAHFTIIGTPRPVDDACAAPGSCRSPPLRGSRLTLGLRWHLDRPLPLRRNLLARAAALPSFRSQLPACRPPPFSLYLRQRPRRSGSDGCAHGGSSTSPSAAVSASAPAHNKGEYAPRMPLSAPLGTPLEATDCLHSHPRALPLAPAQPLAHAPAACWYTG